MFRLQFHGSDQPDKRHSRSLFSERSSKSNNRLRSGNTSILTPGKEMTEVPGVRVGECRGYKEECAWCGRSQSSPCTLGRVQILERLKKTVVDIF